MMIPQTAKSKSAKVEFWKPKSPNVGNNNAGKNANNIPPIKDAIIQPRLPPNLSANTPEVPYLE